MPTRRTLLATALAASAASVLPAGAVQARTSSAAATAYAMAYFKESPNETDDSYALHLAVSTDGLNWTPLNQNDPVATPTAGTQGLRDPFLQRRQDGTFAVLATDLKGRVFDQNNQYIHVWDSADLTSFTGYRRVHLHDLATHAWAPTSFWDPARGAYAVVYSAHNGTRDVFLVNYTTDFVTMGPPEVYFDPGFGVLDGYVLPRAGAFYLAYKNLDTGYLHVARSPDGAPNTYTTLTGGLRQGQAIEAPILVASPTDETFWLWGDSFSPSNAVFYAWGSADLDGDTWSPLNQRDYTAPISAKHAGITPITEAEYGTLVARWGEPRWRRLKSYNHPDRYVRHANHVARLDPFPLEPPADQQWRLVPGLADPGGTSFESVNLPGSYLRHVDFALRLAPQDGTALFAEDATFHAEPGLADSAWVSFRSHNHPDRYVRHQGFLLRLDPIDPAAPQAAREDATFRITP
ncbi:alpha-L-arabinofuranosidase [Streptomyces sp. 3MP-14]|uniref:Alpha-L-arabinofuranosidase n=1 Tax=Streptomyces mimosae TaxID=2586635 RepID=A0A5N6AEW4_9ACTN|nr:MULTISPECIES: glycoside hydrolase family 43 protein [Streptomyces]KAB8166389.1 alpha-L-arabinofuranosidase [Streptomyces mimosae]KAB8174182.1 alpha-L-arabinofuranosidase [Streptomyces sp. 3MP-14]